MPVLDFPDAPTVGQIFTADTKSWTWTGSVWNATGSSSGTPGVPGGSASVVVSQTAPTSPTEGNIWYNSSIGKSFIYYGTSWVGMI